MNQIRCPLCNKRWFDANGTFEISIKCSKCGHHFEKVIDSNKIVIMKNKEK